jgi:hypothetical protein
MNRASSIGRSLCWLGSPFPILILLLSAPSKCVAHATGAAEFYSQMLGSILPPSARCPVLRAERTSPGGAVMSACGPRASTDRVETGGRLQRSSKLVRKVGPEWRKVDEIADHKTVDHDRQSQDKHQPRGTLLERIEGHCHQARDERAERCGFGSWRPASRQFVVVSQAVRPGILSVQLLRQSRRQEGSDNGLA